MKKTLAIMLSVIMLLGCLPFVVNAAYDPTVSGTLENPTEFISGTNYTIGGVDNEGNQLNVTKTVKAGVTFIIPNNSTLTVEPGSNLVVSSDAGIIIMNNAKLVIKQGAKLNALDDIIVYDGGKLEVYGHLYGATNITVNGTGEAKAQVRFPALGTTSGLIDENNEPRIKVFYGSSKNGNIYEDQQGTVAFEEVPASGKTTMLPINQYMYIKAEIVEDEEPFDKYDDSLMNVYFNGVGVPFTQGSHHTILSTSGDITYGRWVSDEYFLNSFNVYLPTGEGYTVYGREGEQSADGETVKLKYGQSFSFKVEIDPEYDMSAYEVYVYNGYGWTDLDTSTILKDIAPAKPDKYGYYTIDRITGEYTIYVVGVVKNETLLMVGDILDLVRNIFDMITGFFNEILAFFGFSLGQDAA